MKVYLVRHGQAVPPSVDSAKPLSDEGRSEVEHVARTLNNMNVKVGSIYHSGKLRAEETALILADVLGATTVRKTGGLSPNDDPGEAIALIEAMDEDVMLVGHLPHLENLLRELVKPSDDDELPEFGTGTLVGVEKTADGWEVFRAVGPHMMW